jgi:hypothetical protein
LPTAQREVPGTVEAPSGCGRTHATGMCLSVWGPGGGQTQGVRTMYGSASLYPKPFALLRAGVPESALSITQSEHPTSSDTPGQRPNDPAARAPRQGPPRRLPEALTGLNRGAV